MDGFGAGSASSQWIHGDVVVGSRIGLRFRSMTLRRSWIAWALILALFVGIVYLASSWSEQTGIDKLRERGTHRLDLYAASLDAELMTSSKNPSPLSI